MGSALVSSVVARLGRAGRAVQQHRDPRAHGTSARCRPRRAGRVADGRAPVSGTAGCVWRRSGGCSHGAWPCRRASRRGSRRPSAGRRRRACASGPGRAGCCVADQPADCQGRATREVGEQLQVRAVEEDGVVGDERRLPTNGCGGDPEIAEVLLLVQRVAQGAALVAEPGGRPGGLVVEGQDAVRCPKRRTPERDARQLR